MKKVIVVALSSVLFLAACKNDKPADNTANTNSVAAASVSAPVTEAVSAKPVANVAETAPPSVTNDRVAPDQAKVNPTQNAPASKGKTTTVKFNEMTYDWGTIKEGEKMTHLFKFTNTGNNDLVISDARGSCGCTVPEWPKEPIKPGKSSEIKVVFDSDHKSGQQSKTVTITANTEPTSIVLMIKGMVEPKEEVKSN